jgi:thiaminase
MTSKTSSEKLKLTEHLMQLDPAGFKRATQVPFLEKAGKGTLEKEVLERWLSQDRLYAQAYMRFASLLMANVRLPAAVAPNNVNEQ